MMGDDSILDQTTTDNKKISIFNFMDAYRDTTGRVVGGMTQIAFADAQSIDNIT